MMKSLQGSSILYKTYRSLCYPKPSGLAPKLNCCLIHSTRQSFQAVNLAYTSYESTSPGITNLEPDAAPIIIQHGLLGSRKNWASLAKVIHNKTGKKVIVPDARNHGDSPHNDELNYDVLAEDIEALMNNLKIPRALLIGHSMGGRAMMTLALTKPSLVEKLVIVDISPINTSPGADSMKKFLSAMEEIRFDEKMQRTTARKMVDDQLKSVVQDSLLRQFLLTNLVENDGRFRWRVNLRAIINNLPHIIGQFSTKNSIFTKPTLFIGGGRSDYIAPKDHGLIRRIFTDCDFQYVPDAGHWVHSEKPHEFLEILLKFINNNK